MSREQNKIKTLLYQVLGKTEPEYKIESTANRILEAFQKVKIAAIDFDIAADMESSLIDKEWLHISYSMLIERRRQLIKLWEIALNIGIADQSNNEKLLAEIMPRLEKMKVRA